MVMGYMKKKPDGEVAEGDGGSQVGTVSDDVGATLTPRPTTSPLATPTIPNSGTAQGSLAANGTKATDAGPSARAILDGALAAYRNANAYSDRGVLQLSYQIDGRPFKEEYPWSTAWAKDGQLQLNVFDTKVRAAGNMLSCFVSEIRTENLKNQQLFLKGNQLVSQLYQDRIARYYLNGGERIPVNESTVPNSTLFAPLAFSLLSGETISPWLRAEVQPQRMNDATIDGVDCYAIQCPSRSGQLVAWIDKKTSLIRRVKLPNALLDRALATDPKVRNLELTAKFSGASFDVSSVAFEKVAPGNGAWPVREFVAPADPLPTNLVGELAPEFTLLDEKRAKVTDRQLKGKPIAMLFVNGGDSDAELIQKLDSLKKTMSRGYEFAVVVGPNVIEKGIEGSWRLSPVIQPSANRTNIPFLADMDGITAASFELSSLPAVVTLDSRLNITYADLLAKPAGYNGKLAISEKWDRNLVAAINAQANGNDVAGDMREKYRGYLDKYFSERDERLVAGYFPGYSLPNQRRVAAVSAKVRREKTARRSDLKLNPRLVWESRKLTSPGNISLVPDSNRRAKGLLILDGWQTVSLFNVDGKPISRKRLKLPEGVAVASIRPLVSATGKQHFAMFSVGGEQVHIFDEAMELVGQCPRSRDGRHSVLACEVLPGSGNGNDQLLVCFGGNDGANAFDTFTGDTRSIGDTAVRALALSGRSVLAADERTGALLSMDNGRVIDDRREYSQVKSGVNGASVFAATAMNGNREWSLVLLDSALKTVQTFAISSAVFGNGLEPISGVSNGDKGLWAVADSSNRIYLLSDSGVWLGDMAAEGRVSGLKLMTIDGRNRLVVSTDQKVECWELNFAPERVGAVSPRAQ